MGKLYKIYEWKKTLFQHLVLARLESTLVLMNKYPCVKTRFSQPGISVQFRSLFRRCSFHLTAFECHLHMILDVSRAAIREKMAAT